MNVRFGEGERVYLREATVADAGLLAEWKNDPLVRRMALGPGPRTTREAEERDLRRTLERSGDLYLILVARDTGEPVGYVRVDWLDAGHRFAWLRFALGRRRGRGLARDGLSCLLGSLFAGGAARVEAEVFGFNERSLRLLQGLGFRREGRKRRAHFDGEAYHDVVVLGLLPGEFRPGVESGRSPAG